MSANPLPRAAAIALLGLACATGAFAQLPKVRGEASWSAAKAAAVPARLAAPDLAASRTASAELAPPTAAELAALGETDKRIAVGVARTLAPSGALGWASLSDGRRVAHLRVRSAGAAAVRAGLSVRNLPAASRLRFATAGSQSVTGEADGALAVEAARAQGLYWGPVVEGDTVVVEVELPAGADPSPVRVAIAQVSHLVAGPKTGFALKSTSGSCQEDVACFTATSPALETARRAVAKLAFTENGATYVCTGTLVNDLDATSQIPYLHTAAHCVGSQAAAATLNTFWFYEAATCGGAAPAPVQLSRGATLLFVNEVTDVALLRLNDKAPAGAWFAGWDPNQPAASTAVLAIHHPQGDVKKVSMGQALGLVSEGGTDLIVAGWLAGTTEPGSSGSGLFTLDGDQYLLRGGLKGGSASCASTGSLADPANRDYYSRLDLDFSGIQTVLGAKSAPEADYTDLWWNPQEPGWGLSVVQHASNATMVVWFTYDESGRAAWFVVSDCKWEGSRRCTGAVYRTRGSPWTQPMPPGSLGLEEAGTLTLDFGDADDLSMRGTVFGTAVSKTAVRQVF